MPATRSSSSFQYPSSFSSVSRPYSYSSTSFPLRQRNLRNVTLDEYFTLFKTDDDYLKLSSTLFSRPDFMMKTSTMRHNWKTVQRLRKEIDKQFDYMYQLYDEMNDGGLQLLLQQDYHFEYNDKRFKTRPFPPRPDTPIPPSRSLTPYSNTSMYYTPDLGTRGNPIVVEDSD